MGIPVLYLIRHGHTQLNASDHFRGDSDVPLTKEGRKDAEEVAEFLEGIEPVFIISSDRVRATETAEILTKHFDAPTRTSDVLRAWDVGEFSGKPRNKENLDSLQKYIDEPYLEVPGGESLDCFTARTMPAIEECFQLALSNGVGFVVVHSSVIHQLGHEMLSDHKSLVVEPGGIVAISLENGQPSAKSIFKPISTPTHGESIS
jgi:broad specificity phosphatase PhoE